MIRSELAELSAFATVAEERSFTRAASRLGISQSALSHSVRGLEKRLGLQLLARTTRSVSPTATQMVILPKLARFNRTYPEIILEITSSNDPVDLVAGEYDAGVQLGEFIQRDMIAVRVTKEMRLAVVGSPGYFESNPIPRSPRDLKDHSCIGFRFSNGLYRWEFEKGRKTLTVSPQGPASFDDPDLVIQAVLDGVGIGTTMEDTIADLIADRRLVQVLRDWCPSFPGYFLYYPSRHNQPPALSALISALRLSE